MKPLFDTQAGIFNISDQITLRENMTTSEAEKLGIKFVEEYEMNMGWIMKVAKINLKDQERRLCFDFCKDTLQTLSFSLREAEDSSYNDTFERQNSFLRKELGEPHKIKADRWVDYNYPWGEIASVIDIRNLSASIVMNWEKR